MKYVPKSWRRVRLEDPNSYAHITNIVKNYIDLIYNLITTSMMLLFVQRMVKILYILPEARAHLILLAALLTLILGPITTS